MLRRGVVRDTHRASATHLCADKTQPQTAQTLSSFLLVSRKTSPLLSSDRSDAAPLAEIPAGPIDVVLTRTKLQSPRVLCPVSPARSTGGARSSTEGSRAPCWPRGTGRRRRPRACPAHSSPPRGGWTSSGAAARRAGAWLN